MQAFEPIFLGRGARFCAVCDNGWVYVADANIYDREHNDRATVIYRKPLNEILSLGHLIAEFAVMYPYEFCEERDQKGLPFWAIDEIAKSI